MTPPPDDPRKRPYLKPDLETEKIFDVNAPTCGKCSGSGPYGSMICNRLKKTS